MSSIGIAWPDCMGKLVVSVFEMRTSWPHFTHASKESRLRIGLDG